MSAAVSRWPAEFNACEAALPGAELPWLRTRRREAFERFLALGFPGSSDEDWRYTDVRPIARRDYRLAADTAGAAPADLAPADLADVLHTHLLIDGSLRLVFFDGVLQAEYSTLQNLPLGLRILTLAQALREQPRLLERHLARYADFGQHGFAALNLAFAGSGALIHLSAQATLERPIELLYLRSGRADEVAHVRNLIIAEPGSRASLIETYGGQADGHYLTTAETEIHLGERAELAHYRLARESSGGHHIGGVHVQVEGHARYVSHNLSLGGRLLRNELAVTLNAQGASCELNGLVLGRGRQHIDNHTRIEHRAPHGTSQQAYKSVLQDHARSVFAGRVVVHPGAQKTDARQANHNLLLSPDAEADSKPQLEIYADDVQCAHGATVGQLDADAMFYLKSRAIDAGFAQSLLVYAFAADVLQRMELAPVRLLLERELTGRLFEHHTQDGLLA